MFNCSCVSNQYFFGTNIHTLVQGVFNCTKNTPYVPFNLFQCLFFIVYILQFLSVDFLECSQKLITQIPKHPLTLRHSVEKDFWEEQNEINPYPRGALFLQYDSMPMMTIVENGDSF